MDLVVLTALSPEDFCEAGLALLPSSLQRWSRRVKASRASAETPGHGWDSRERRQR